MSEKETPISFDEALALTLQTARELCEELPVETRELDLWEARGAVLAAPVLADRDQPPFDRAAMDGYAVRAGDVRAAEARLEVVGEVRAGERFTGEVGPGQTVAIMTGAPMPEGPDSVQMVERTRPDGDGHASHVLIEGPVAPGLNVAKRGEHVAAGSVAVEAGREVDGLTVGVLAAMGATRVEVYRPPRVAVLATGDELVSIDAEPSDAQIRDSNRHVIMALAYGADCLVVDGGRIPDDMGALRKAVREGMESDVLVLSGGVSAGRYDLVEEALQEEGVRVVFHKALIKPGRPTLVGRHAGGMVFGLPGYPVSSFVTANLFLLPALRILGHRPAAPPITIRARLDGELPAVKGRTTFMPGVLLQEPGSAAKTVVRAVSFTGSADQVRFARANCLIRRDIGAGRASDGEEVIVLPLLFC